MSVVFKHWIGLIYYTRFHIQSTLVISKSKGPAETLWDIRTPTYQMCRIEENTKQTTKFHKWTCSLTPLMRNMCWKYCGKRGKIAPEEQFLPLSTIFYYLMLDFYVKIGIRFSLRDKRLFEITEVEITWVDCVNSMSYATEYVWTSKIQVPLWVYFKRLITPCLSITLWIHTCQLSEIFMGETARESTFLTHIFKTKRAGKISWNFHGGDIFLTYKQA